MFIVVPSLFKKKTLSKINFRKQPYQHYTENYFSINYTLLVAFTSWFTTNCAIPQEARTINKPITP